MTTQRWRVPLAALLLTAGCATAAVAPGSSPGSDLLYVWSADADEDAPDFLAVVDAARGSPTYGTVLHTVPVEGRGQWSHHTEYELTPGRTLFASGWGTGSTFVFDMADPLAPKVATVFTTRGGYGYPHSYARLANGNVLATFQSSGDGYGRPGGLVELTDAGEFVRGVSGVSPDVPAGETWTYSLLVLPDLDRVVTTNTRMGLVSEWKSAMRAEEDTSHEHVNQDVRSTHVQVWRLSDLALLHTLKLPANQAGQNAWTAEARRLANGDVYVNTFSCGLYRLAGLDGDAPTVTPALFSPYEEGRFCAVPVTIGNFWIQPSATERAIVSLDLSDPANPREVSRLALDSVFAGPHWIAADPAAPRIVVTSDMGAWVLIADVDTATGALSLDENFRSPGTSRAGLDFDRSEWPHGTAGRAMPHGAVFGSRAREADTLPAAVVQRFVDAANARDAAAMAALVAPEAVFARFPDGPVFAQGRDSIHAFYARRLPPLSPGFRITVQPRIVEGHLVIDRERFAGTPAEQGHATWMYQVYGGLIHRAWVLDGHPPQPSP